MPTDDIISCLISKCITNKNLKLGMALHSHLIKTALTFNPFLANSILSMYSKCNEIQSAQKVFNDLPIKNTHSWNSLISGYTHLGLLDKARNLFDKMPEPNLVSYNSLISGLSRHGFHKESIDMFTKMQKDDFFMDNFTFVSIASVCACLGALELLRQVHGVLILIGIELSRIAKNALVDAYGKCGDSDSAYSVFSGMSERDVVSWTSMIVAYGREGRLDDASGVFHEMPVKNDVSWTALITSFVQNKRGTEALSYFKKMLEEGIKPNAITFVTVLSACADLALVDKGKQIHGKIFRYSDGNVKDCFHNVYIGNALIDMYCKCGDMSAAKTLFNRMHEKDIVSWNSMITGLAQNGYSHESITFFTTMTSKPNMNPNHVTFLGVLSACSHTGLVSEGLNILDRMEKSYGLNPGADHYAIVIDLLGRKNRVEEAVGLINRVPNCGDRVGMWGAVLGACRLHGNLDVARIAAEALFEIEPGNAARYVMLSNVYAEAGRWEESRKVRKIMVEKGLKKESGYSWIEVKNGRHEFVAMDKRHCQVVKIYEVILVLVDHIKEAGYLPYTDTQFLDEDDDLSS